MHWAGAQDHTSTLDALGGVITKAAAIAVSVAVGYQVPLWFCVACPVVLGLLAPLIINAGAGAVANAACEHYKLPDADCAELWCALQFCCSLVALAPFHTGLPSYTRQRPALAISWFSGRGNGACGFGVDCSTPRF